MKEVFKGILAVSFLVGALIGLAFICNGIHLNDGTKIGYGCILAIASVIGAGITIEAME